MDFTKNYAVSFELLVIFFYSLYSKLIFDNPSQFDKQTNFEKRNQSCDTELKRDAKY